MALQGSAPQRSSREDRTDATEFGERIRYARRFKGWRLKDLAREAQCSESLLSKIENNRALPSIALLHRIADRLDTNIAWLLTTTDDRKDVVLKRSSRVSIDFAKYVPAEGTHMERLAPFHEGQLLEAVVLVVAPGGHSKEPIEHAGEDAGYVLEGDIELLVGERTFRLQAGDAFQFRSERSHGYRNVGSAAARILWISTTQPRPPRARPNSG